MLRNIRTLNNQANKSNYQDLLKVVALVCMLIDHLGLYVMPDQIAFRIIGRAAMPIFAFYAGYNFHNNIRHMVWVFGLIITVGFYIEFGMVFGNILIAIALGQVYLFYAGKALVHDSSRFFRHFMALLTLAIVTWEVTEFGTLVILFMMVGFIRANGQRDPGYLLLAGLSLAIHNQCVWNFTTMSQFSAALFSVLVSISLLHYIPHNNSMGINLKPISRNMLYIYTVTTLAYIFYIELL